MLTYKQQEELATFLNNCRHAVRNREDTVIGGGIFSPYEIDSVYSSIKQLLDESGH